MNDDSPSQRLESALEMSEDGVCIMRENLRRQFPTASFEELAAALDRWLTTRPGAEHGDGEGVVVVWPRSKR